MIWLIAAVIFGQAQRLLSTHVLLRNRLGVSEITYAALVLVGHRVDRNGRVKDGQAEESLVNKLVLAELAKSYRLLRYDLPLIPLLN